MASLTLGTCTVVILSACVSVATRSAAYLLFTPKKKVSKGSLWCFQGFYRVAFRLKTLHSRVLASFAAHHRLPRSSASFRWTKETVIPSFQLKKYVYMVSHRSNKDDWFITDRSALKIRFLALHAIDCCYCKGLLIVQSRTMCFLW